MSPYHGAVLIVGSLRWDPKPVRKNWRFRRLVMKNAINVYAPIRYGRKSGGERKNTYTMIFSNLCYQEGLGAALLVPFRTPVVTFRDLKIEAAELWHAERPASNKTLHEISYEWGAAGLFVNPNIDFSSEIIAEWKGHYQIQDEKPQIKYSPNEIPIISDDGMLIFEWPKRIDDGQPVEFDFILATATKPNPNMGIYPKASVIAQAIVTNNYRKYFNQNRKYKITTFQDNEIEENLKANWNVPQL